MRTRTKSLNAGTCTELSRTSLAQGTRQKAKGKRQKAKGKRQKPGHMAADLVSILHKVDALVHIPKQDECLDHVQAGNQNRSVKERGAHQTAACPLVGLQAVANREDDVPFQTCQVGNRTPEFPAAILNSCGRRRAGGWRVRIEGWGPSKGRGVILHKRVCEGVAGWGQDHTAAIQQGVRYGLQFCRPKRTAPTPCVLCFACSACT